MEAQTFDDVFNALVDTCADAENLKARADLLSALITHVRSWKLPPKAAAKRLGVTRIQFNNLLRGKLGQFSFNFLVSLAVAADLEPDSKVSH